LAFMTVVTFRWVRRSSRSWPIWVLRAVWLLNAAFAITLIPPKYVAVALCIVLLALGFWFATKVVASRDVSTTRLGWSLFVLGMAVSAAFLIPYAVFFLRPTLPGEAFGASLAPIALASVAGIGWWAIATADTNRYEISGSAIRWLPTGPLLVVIAVTAN